jgi:hypothetical protein
MKRAFLAAVALAISSTAFAQAKVASLDWMTGTWSQPGPEGRVTETWVGPENGLMVAVNLSTWKNGRRFYEFLRIEQTPEGFSYFASPGGRDPVEFKMKEQGERKVVFENPKHDFPQRIIYWRDGEQLLARIEGSRDSKERKEEWRFTRQK